MRKLFVMLVVVTLAVAACGDDNGSASGSGSGSGSETEDTTKAPVSLSGDVSNHGTKEVADGAKLEVEQDDFYFSPTFVKATPGAKITVELHNEGDADHTFTIDGTDVDETVKAGDTAEVEVTLPDSGATAFYCRFHKDSGGMQGAFFFNDGDAVGNAASQGDTGY